MSLRIKILGAMALVLAISVGGSFLVLIQYWRAHLLRNTADATTHLTNTIKATLEHAMLTRDPSEIQRIVRTVGEQPGVEGAFILDHNGVVKVASDLDQVGRLLREGQPAWPADIQGGQTGERSLTTVLQRQPFPVLRITSLIPTASRCQSCHPANQQVLGALVVDRSLARMEQQLRAGLAYMLGAAGLAFLLLTGTTYAVLRRLVVTPLAELGEAARAIEAGKYDTPMAAHSRDEVGDLARTLDQMRHHIEGRTRDLQAANLKLMVEITDRKRAEEIRQALYQATREIQTSRKIEDRLDRFLRTARDVLRLDRVNVLLADPAGQWLQAVASLGTDDPLGTIRVPIGPEGGGLAQAYQTQETVVWDGQAPMPEALRLKPPYDRMEALRSRVFAIVPLVVQGRAVGVLGADRKHSRQPIEPGTLELLQLFAGHAAPAIEHARMYEELRQAAIQLEAKVEDRTRELQAANLQLQEATRRAEEASRHKSEFLANMSHELRTPLNSILGFSQLLLEQPQAVPPERQTRYLTNIYNSGQHLLQLITDILDLAKVEAGKITLERVALPVAATLDDILVIGRGLANKKGQRIEVEIAPDLPPLAADPVRFKQILFNLLSNAVKFTPEGGRISVTARKLGSEEARKLQEHGGQGLPASQPPSLPAGEFLELAVADTGPGIRADDLPKLFREFTQLATTAAQAHEGTGLGLALTKKLVELHGGTITASSEGEGKGSTFTVRLPVGKKQ